MLDYCVCTCIVLVPTLTATFYSSEPWGGLCTIQIYIKVLVRILIPADRSIYRKHNTYIFSCECQTITRLLADDFNFNPHINKSLWIFDRLLLPCWFQKVSLTIDYNSSPTLVLCSQMYRRLPAAVLSSCFYSVFWNLK